jgi:hypothetical protein
MADLPKGARKFNDEEVALIIKRAAELQQTEQVEQEPSTAMTLADIEEIAKEAGIDPRLIRHAAQTLERPADVNRPSPWVGAPTRLVIERVVDGEIPLDEFEPLVNEMRRTFGDNGIPSVLGKTLAWSSTQMGGRRSNHSRRISVLVASRGGVTTIRVEEELRPLAGALFGGLVGGGGGGTTGITMGIGMGLLHSPTATGLLWVTVATGFYTLARTIFGRMSAKRERQLRELADRLVESVSSVAAVGPDQVAAASTRSISGSGRGTGSS